MLVEAEKIRQFASDRLPWVQIQTAVGRTAVPWHGAPDAPPGQYHVEWTIDQIFKWRVDAKPAPEPGPAIRTGSHCVILRGRLHLEPDMASMLDLDGSMIQLEFSEPVPAEFNGAWVQLHVLHKNVGLYPYNL